MNFTQQMALSHVTNYRDFADYEAHENNDKEEFNEKLDNGSIQDITLSTYNGATQTTRYWALTDNNILGAILQDIEEGELWDMLADSEQEADAMTNSDYIEAYMGMFPVFTLDEHVYVKRD